MRKYLMLILLVSAFFSCTKKETIYVNEHENQLINGNTAPPFSGVTTLQVQNYINKSYIDLLGREPGDTELETQSSLLKNNGLGDNAKEILLNNLINTDEYYIRFFDIYRRSHLNGVLESQIEELILTMEYFYDQYQNDPDPLLQAYAEYLLVALEKMEDLQNARTDYQSGTINVNQFMARIIDNEVYNEINMGSENFVIAAFNNLFKRNPTAAELERGITMVDGQPAQLLLQDGTNKDDFVAIITSNLEFHEGLTFDIYNTLLAREPSSVEMDASTLNLNTNSDFQLIQKTVMKSEEYVGF